MKTKKKETRKKDKTAESKSSEDKAIIELQDSLDKLESEKQELQDKFTRLFAEFDNYKKRTAREKLELLGSAGSDVMESLIPVLDDFERGIKASSGKDSEGIELIYNKLNSVLKGKGLTTLETKPGDDFDLDLHEAITKIPAPSEDLKDKVVDVIEKGYKMGDRIIRFAKVVIGE
jgi:molecular chaperone GrpE